MQEIVDKSSGAILFKKSEEERARDKQLQSLEDEVQELKEQLAALLKSQNKSNKK